MPENAPASNLLDKFTAALKRTPGNLAGGAVDVSNMVLGLVTGKGLGGFVDKPMGGSKQLNELAGLPEPTSTGQALAESALGMINPGAALKGTGLAVASLIPLMAGAKTGVKLATGPGGKQAGIIVPALPDVTSKLGIESIVEDALSMTAAGASPWKVGATSEAALRAKRNPGEALSVFIGPDGIPRIKLDTANTRLASNAPVATSYDAAKLTPKMRPAKDQLEGPETALSDWLLHPSIYDLVPTLRDTKVRTNSFLDLFGGDAAYNAGTNTILLPTISYPPARMAKDPLGYLHESLLHEAGHAVQGASGTRSGTVARVDELLKSVTDARTMGSFRTSAELDSIEALLNKLKAGPDSTNKESVLHRIYTNQYGEWEARQGSQYGKSLPMMNERGSTY